jgi:hypothetical protein
MIFHYAWMSYLFADFNSQLQEVLSEHMYFGLVTLNIVHFSAYQAVYRIQPVSPFLPATGISCTLTLSCAMWVMKMHLKQEEVKHQTL